MVFQMAPEAPVRCRDPLRAEGKEAASSHPTALPGSHVAPILLLTFLLEAPVTKEKAAPETLEFPVLPVTMQPCCGDVLGTVFLRVNDQKWSVWATEVRLKPWRTPGLLCGIHGASSVLQCDERVTQPESVPLPVAGVPVPQLHSQSLCLYLWQASLSLSYTASVCAFTCGRRPCPSVTQPESVPAPRVRRPCPSVTQPESVPLPVAGVPVPQLHSQSLCLYLWQASLSLSYTARVCAFTCGRRPCPSVTQPASVPAPRVRRPCPSVTQPESVPLPVAGVPVPQLHSQSLCLYLWQASLSLSYTASVCACTPCQASLSLSYTARVCAFTCGRRPCPSVTQPESVPLPVAGVPVPQLHSQSLCLYLWQASLSLSYTASICACTPCQASLSLSYTASVCAFTCGRRPCPSVTQPASVPAPRGRRPCPSVTQPESVPLPVAGVPVPQLHSQRLCLHPVSGVPVPQLHSQRLCLHPVAGVHVPQLHSQSLCLYLWQASLSLSYTASVCACTPWQASLSLSYTASVCAFTCGRRPCPSVTQPASVPLPVAGVPVPQLHSQRLCLYLWQASLSLSYTARVCAFTCGRRPCPSVTQPESVPLPVAGVPVPQLHSQSLCLHPVAGVPVPQLHSQSLCLYLWQASLSLSYTARVCAFTCGRRPCPSVTQPESVPLPVAGVPVPQLHSQSLCLYLWQASLSLSYTARVCAFTCGRRPCPSVTQPESVPLPVAGVPVPQLHSQSLCLHPVAGVPVPQLHSQSLCLYLWQASLSLSYTARVCACTPWQASLSLSYTARVCAFTCGRRPCPSVTQPASVPLPVAGVPVPQLHSQSLCLYLWQASLSLSYTARVCAFTCGRRPCPSVTQPESVPLPVAGVPVPQLHSQSLCLHPVAGVPVPQLHSQSLCLYLWQASLSLSYTASVCAFTCGRRPCPSVTQPESVPLPVAGVPVPQLHSQSLCLYLWQASLSLSYTARVCAFTCGRRPCPSVTQPASVPAPRVRRPCPSVTQPASVPLPVAGVPVPQLHSQRLCLYLWQASLSLSYTASVCAFTCGRRPCPSVTQPESVPLPVAGVPVPQLHSQSLCLYLWQASLSLSYTARVCACTPWQASLSLSYTASVCACTLWQASLSLSYTASICACTPCQASLSLSYTARVCAFTCGRRPCPSVTQPESVPLPVAGVPVPQLHSQSLCLYLWQASLSLSYTASVCAFSCGRRPCPSVTQPESVPLPVAGVPVPQLHSQSLCLYLWQASLSLSYTGRVCAFTCGRRPCPSVTQPASVPLPVAGVPVPQLHSQSLCLHPVSGVPVPQLHSQSLCLYLWQASLSLSYTARVCAFTCGRRPCPSVTQPASVPLPVAGVPVPQLHSQRLCLYLWQASLSLSYTASVCAFTCGRRPCPTPSAPSLSSSLTVWPQPTGRASTPGLLHVNTGVLAVQQTPSVPGPRLVEEHGTGQGAETSD
ncbi:uncharacterized protein LOC144578541 [Callithrix jacchus]